MKKFFFYTSIIILCVLVWLNKKNKEGIVSPNVFIGMSPENLYNIYKTIDDNPLPNQNTQQTNQNTNENIDKEEVSQPYIVTKQQPASCSTKSEIIEKLKLLEINDEAFKTIINPPDNNLDLAYDKLIIQIKTVRNVIYKTCDTKKEEYCPPLPICYCITDQNMCNNYKYLDFIFNDPSSEDLLILGRINSGAYNSPELKNVTELDVFKTTTLKNYLLPLPS